MKISEAIKLIENKTGKKVILRENDSEAYISEITKAFKKVGLKPQKIVKDENYLKTYLCEYKSPGNYSIKTFLDMQKLLDCSITFRPKDNTTTYFWFNFYYS
jgi:hypothetical protein